MKFLSSLGVMVAVLLALACSLVAPSARAQDNLTNEQVDQAVDEIIAFLYKTQAEDGGWYGSYHPGPDGNAKNRNNWGPTAMAVLSLIVAGESPQNPKIKKALELLAKVEITGVYALSMRAHVWSYLPQDIFGGRMEDDANTMLQTAYGKARFNYLVHGAEGFEKDKRRIDNSTTQYGVLALWQADKLGLKIPDSFWVDAVENFLQQQSQSDGGWAYKGDRNTSQTMTCAGLTVLFVAQQELFREETKPNPQITKAIEKGLVFLNKNFDPNHKVHGGTGYMWYGYERVGLASGIKYFGGKDWFQMIAKKIVAKKANYGRAIHSAAFELMFLARGRVPVWINKLQIPGVAWNNRPNDVYFLNRFISEYREHEVNWQVVGIGSNPKDWISAPLMWISSDSAIQWTDQHVAKLKTYLDLGGTIIANPEEQSSSFRSSIHDLAEKLYPELKFEDMPRDHPMASLLEGDPRGSRSPDVQILSNGARVLMIMPKRDWGMTFQKDKNPDPDKSKPWQNIVNIYGVVTDRGELTPRLATSWVDKASRGSTGSIKVFVPQWDDAAGKVNEQDVYQVMKNVMHNETGKSLEIVKLPLTELAAADPALVHMMGVNAVSLTEAERAAVKAYVDSGGTILIETLGGIGGFASSLRDQLSSLFPGVEDKVSSRSDIITGRNLPEGSKSNRRVIFRRMVIERSNPDGRLTLRGWEKEKRYPVLLSYEDLSLGMLGIKQYGINGYSVQSSRDLMINILLEAEKAKSGG